MCTVAVFVAPPTAVADPGASSYDRGKQAIDDQVINRHVPFIPSDRLPAYCRALLGNVTKSGMMPKVDSPPDFVASRQDEGSTFACFTLNLTATASCLRCFQATAAAGFSGAPASRVAYKMSAQPSTVSKCCRHWITSAARDLLNAKPGSSPPP